MPTLTINGNAHTTEDGKRLVLAIKDSGEDILHRCGGYAGCTTCRVTFDAGEPDKMTEADLAKLDEQGNTGKFRLSYQILCEGDMTVTPLMTLANTELDDPGSRPEDNITPDPVWVNKPDA